LLGIAVGFAGLGDAVPEGEEDPAGDAGAARVGGDDFDVGAAQIGPLPDLFGVAGTGDDRDGGLGDDRFMREFVFPVVVDQVGLNDFVDVESKGQVGDVGFESIEDRAGLGTGAAVALVDRNALVVFVPPLFFEFWNNLLVGGFHDREAGQGQFDRVTCAAKALTAREAQGEDDDAQNRPTPPGRSEAVPDLLYPGAKPPKPINHREKSRHRKNLQFADRDTGVKCRFTLSNKLTHN
jgi:hypothetical protein